MMEDSSELYILHTKVRRYRSRVSVLAELFPRIQLNLWQVAIIDPRTGELLHSWSVGSEGLKPESVIEKCERRLSEYCSA